MPFDPLYMTESTVSLDGTGYEAEVSGFRLTPTYATATWKGLKKGSTFTRSGLATWALTINFGQDHQAAESLSNFLFDHEGETVPFNVAPIGGGTGYSGDAICQAGEIGGDVDQFGNATVTMPVLGKPERTIATPPDPEA